MFYALAFTVGFAALSSFTHAGAPTKPSVSVAIKDTNVEGGLEGLDLNWLQTYNLNGIALGFKYAINANKDRPESLFAKKTFSTIGDGDLTLDSEFNLPKNTFSLLSTWASKKCGLVVSALASSKDKLQKLTLKHDATDIFGAESIRTSVEFETDENKVAVDVSYGNGDTAFNLALDNQDYDPIFKVSHKIENDILCPEVSLKTGNVAYGWTRKWDGGSLESVVKLNDELTMKWKDEAKAGNWLSKVTVPLDKSGKKAKISISRDFAV